MPTKFSVKLAVIIGIGILLAFGMNFHRLTQGQEAWNMSRLPITTVTATTTTTGSGIVVTSSSTTTTTSSTPVSTTTGGLIITVLKLTQVAGGECFGLLTDINGNPLSGKTVKVFTSDNNYLYTTNDQGKFITYGNAMSAVFMGDSQHAGSSAAPVMVLNLLSLLMFNLYGSVADIGDVWIGLLVVAALCFGYVIYSRRRR